MCSDDTIAEPNADTIAALRSKHPSAQHDSVLPPAPVPYDLKHTLLVTDQDVACAIRSFPQQVVLMVSDHNSCWI